MYIVSPMRPSKRESGASAYWVGNLASCGCPEAAGSRFQVSSRFLRRSTKAVRYRPIVEHAEVVDDTGTVIILPKLGKTPIFYSVIFLNLASRRISSNFFNILVRYIVTLV